MSRIVIIGGSGHVGSYLVPRLVELGHEIVNVSRGAANPYRQHYAWSQVKNISLDRQVEEKTGQFGKKIAKLNPDIVIDMILLVYRAHSILLRRYAVKLNISYFVVQYGYMVDTFQFLQLKQILQTL